MKKFIAALAGLAIVAAPISAAATPYGAYIPHGTLRCSSFTTRLAHDCIHIKVDGGHWRVFNSGGYAAWRLTGRADSLYRYQHHDALKPNVG